MNDALAAVPRAAEEVLAFWFGPTPDDPATPGRQAALWWDKVPALDEEIRRRFADLRQRTIQREPWDWLDSPRGRLAAIILVDQFSRNLFRGSPESFRHDPLALRWCQEGLEAGADHELRPIECTFLYMPLLHSEDLRDQDHAVALFEALAAEVSAPLREPFRGYLRSAQRHRDIVARFGRFPHRNAILGRASTPTETAFLQEPGSSF